MAGRTFWRWSVAFALSVVGMVITIINFAFCQKWVKQYGSKPDFAPVHMGKLLATIAGVVVLVVIATWLLHNQVSHVWCWASSHWVSS